MSRNSRNTPKENPKSILAAILIIAVVGAIIFFVAELFKPKPSLVERMPLGAEVNLDQPFAGMYFDLAEQSPRLTFPMEDAIQIAALIDSGTAASQAGDDQQWVATLSLSLNRGGNETYLVSPEGVLKNRNRFIRVSPEMLYEVMFRETVKNEKYLSLLKKEVAAVSETLAPPTQTTLGEASENMEGDEQEQLDFTGHTD